MRRWSSVEICSISLLQFVAPIRLEASKLGRGRGNVDAFPEFLEMRGAF